MKFLLVLCLTALVFGDEAVNEPVKEVHETQEVPAHKQIFSFAHLPSFPQFFPSVNFPQFHLPSFPQFPTLPQLPSFSHHVPAPFKKETVTATKTVFVEVTKKVTRHPICVTAYGITPPCLGEYHRDILDEFDEEMEQQRAQIIPTAVASISEPATRILGHITESEVTVEENKEQSIPGESRQGRYIVRHPVTIFPTRGEIRTEPQSSENQNKEKQEEAIQGTEKIVPGILKATHHVTKTLWVTKVEKVIDHGVTATLVAKNCFPSDPKIPLCGPIHGTHHPGGGIVGAPLEIGGSSHGNKLFGGLFGNSLHKQPGHATPIVHGVKEDDNKEESEAVESEAVEVEAAT